VYFDGSTDYLDIAGSTSLDLDGTDWTIEGWVYRTGTGTEHTFFSSSPHETLIISLNRTNNGDTQVFTGNGSSWVNTTAINSGTNYPILANTWSHIALVKNGNSIYLYHNGNSVGSSTDVPSGFTGNVRAGAYYDVGSPGQHLTGYVSDFRVTKSAVYSGAFTPPSGPLTATGGTYPSTTNVDTSITAALHIKGTDASIIDKSQVNNIKMNGPTTGSTTKSAFGSEPTISFASGSNTNRYLNFDPTVLKFIEILGKPSIPFTIEGIWGWQGSTASPIFEIFQDTNNFFYFGGGPGGTRSGITTDNNLYAIFKIGGVERFKMTAGIGSYNNVGSSFKHQAITRNSSGVMQHYYDGQLRTNTITHSGYDTVSWTSPVGYVGRSDWMGIYGRYEGYIHQIRLTVGLARYTANFTAPTASLEG
jgi:hypothetical protein